MFVKWGLSHSWESRGCEFPCRKRSRWAHPTLPGGTSRSENSVSIICYFTSFREVQAGPWPSLCFAVTQCRPDWRKFLCQMKWTGSLHCQKNVTSGKFGYFWIIPLCFFLSCLVSPVTRDGWLQHNYMDSMARPCTNPLCCRTILFLMLLLIILISSPFFFGELFELLLCV